MNKTNQYLRYSEDRIIVIRWEQGEGQYSATISGEAHFTGYGDSYEDALKHLIDMIEEEA